MQDGIALPIVCAAKSDSIAQWFACLKVMMNHPLLHEEEKYLWLWLATQSTNNLSFSCSFNYEQIATAVNKSSRKIHRILTRLRIMGFLVADLPIYYGEPTPEMVKEIRILKLVLRPKPIFVPEGANALLLPQARRNGAHKMTINLLKKENERKKLKHFSWFSWPPNCAS